MLDWSDTTIIINNLVQYFTGSYDILAVVILMIFFITLITFLDVRYALTFTLPLAGFFVAIGWFGQVTNSQWIVNIILIAVSLVYGWAILKIST